MGIKKKQAVVKFLLEASVDLTQMDDDVDFSNPNKVILDLIENVELMRCVSKGYIELTGKVYLLEYTDVD